MTDAQSRATKVAAEPAGRRPDLLPQPPIGQWEWWWLALPVLLFVILRLPAVLHAPGGQDEHWFSVPGYTVWQEGIPRIPYVPTRNRETFFENADRCLMTLPPALFYLQAPFFAVFPAGYPTARLPLFLAAIFTLGLTWMVTRTLSRSISAALLATTVMALCRPLMFTGMTVRPDLGCAACGWCTLLAIYEFAAHRNRLRWLALAGGCCGLAALFHPFALVFAMQGGFILLALRGTLWQRMLRLGLFGTCTGLVTASWLPLILRFPYEFRSQFFANVVDRAGPGLPARLVAPWASLRHHAQLLYEFLGLWQCVFLRDQPARRFMVVMAASTKRFCRQLHRTLLV